MCMPEARVFRRAGRGKSAPPVRRGESGSRYSRRPLSYSTGSESGAEPRQSGSGWYGYFAMKPSVKLANLLSSWFGCGYAPFAPGTAGSAAALAIGIGLVYAGLPWWGFLVRSEERRVGKDER